MAALTGAIPAIGKNRYIDAAPHRYSRSRGSARGAADSFVLSHDVPSIFAGHYDPSFPIALCLKDLALIKELMDHVGTTNTLTEATHERFREAGRRYGTAAGEMTVCKVIEDDTGIDLRVAGEWVKPWEVAHG
jgi:hypothetical protein